MCNTRLAREVRKIGNKTISDQYLTQIEWKDWKTAADCVLLAAIVEQDGRNAAALWDDAMKMWDGKGFRDLGAKNTEYETYKLALAIIVGTKQNRSDDRLVAMRQLLLKLQHGSGGWTFWYDTSLKPGSDLVPNPFSTCLAILALEPKPPPGRAKYVVTVDRLIGGKWQAEPSLGYEGSDLSIAEATYNRYKGKEGWDAKWSER